MSPIIENLDPAAEPAPNDANSAPLPPPTPKKRNSGRTGPITPEGRARSAKNAVKHGSCALTLILSSESETGWHRLLGRWVRQYQPTTSQKNQPCLCPCPETGDCEASGTPVCACSFDDTLDYDFVLKAAQAEWHRIRCQRNFDVFLQGVDSTPPGQWTPEQTKEHDLLLRYKTAAERVFQRDYRLLEQHVKAHSPKAAHPQQQPPKPQPDTLPQPKAGPLTRVMIQDPASPTGFLVVDDFPPTPGVVYPFPAPPPPNPPAFVKLMAKEDDGKREPQL